MASCQILCPTTLVWYIDLYSGWNPTLDDCEHVSFFWARIEAKKKIKWCSMSKQHTQIKEISHIQFPTIRNKN